MISSRIAIKCLIRLMKHVFLTKSAVICLLLRELKNQGFHSTLIPNISHGKTCDDEVLETKDKEAKSVMELIDRT